MSSMKTVLEAVGDVMDMCSAPCCFAGGSLGPLMEVVTVDGGVEGVGESMANIPLKCRSYPTPQPTRGLGRWNEPTADTCP
jgi:hypothetical protein